MVLYQMQGRVKEESCPWGPDRIYCPRHEWFKWFFGPSFPHLKNEVVCPNWSFSKVPSTAGMLTDSGSLHWVSNYEIQQCGMRHSPGREDHRHQLRRGWGSQGWGQPWGPGWCPLRQGKMEKSGVTLRKSSPSEVEGNWVGGNSSASY